MSRLMDFLADLVHRLMFGVSRALGPVVAFIETINFAIRAQLERVHVPFGAQGWIVAAIWAAVLLALLWALRGWWRVGAVLCLAVVLARYFQVLPFT